MTPQNKHKKEMNGGIYHILPHSTKGWGIIRGGAYRTSAFASTKRAAEKIAWKYIKTGRAEIVCIHDNMGKIINILPPNL